MVIATSILHVAALALLFGAGIPLLFALGVFCLAGPRNAARNALGWVIFALLAAVILVAITWIAKDALNHYFGWNLFPGLSNKH